MLVKTYRFSISVKLNNNSVIQETASGNLVLNADLDVDGRTELDISDATEIKKIQLVYQHGGVILYHDANEKIRTSSSGIDITGHTETDTLRVSGISTFTGNIDANGDLDVDGRTELDITNISETLNVVGIATFANNIDANGDLDVDGHTELDDLNVSGVSTFANNIDANGNLDVDGQTDLDVLNVSDTATFSANVDLGDDNRLRLGDGNDLQIFHNGSSSFMKWELETFLV